MSETRCAELDRRLAAGELDAEAAARWREHVAGCADCREQEAADALLRAALDSPPPRLSAGFADGLRRELDRRVAGRPGAHRPGRLRPAGLWALAGYGTAALAASVAILVSLPWESLTVSPAAGIALGAIALISPLALLDRVGIVHPPG